MVFRFLATFELGMGACVGFCNDGLVGQLGIDAGGVFPLYAHEYTSCMEQGVTDIWSLGFFGLLDESWV